MTLMFVICCIYLRDQDKHEYEKNCSIIQLKIVTLVKYFALRYTNSLPKFDAVQFPWCSHCLLWHKSLVAYLPLPLNEQPELEFNFLSNSSKKVCEEII